MSLLKNKYDSLKNLLPKDGVVFHDGKGISNLEANMFSTLYIKQLNGRMIAPLFLGN